MGHKTLQMVKRYSHLSDDHKATVLEKMEEVFEELIDRKLKVNFT
jgi:hypothetical protein